MMADAAITDDAVDDREQAALDRIVVSWSLSVIIICCRLKIHFTSCLIVPVLPSAYQKGGFAFVFCKIFLIPQKLSKPSFLH